MMELKACVCVRSLLWPQPVWSPFWGLFFSFPFGRKPALPASRHPIMSYCVNTVQAQELAVWSSHCLLGSAPNSPWKLLLLLNRKPFDWLLATIDWKHTSLNTLQELVTSALTLPFAVTTHPFLSPVSPVPLWEGGWLKGQVDHVPSQQAEMWVLVPGLSFGVAFCLFLHVLICCGCLRVLSPQIRVTDKILQWLAFEWYWLCILFLLLLYYLYI